ncbi:MAG: hypothetical protein QM767_00720 [Anaeromyxobacter sp.]
MARWTTCTSSPCSRRPRAASSPSRPPPITAATFAVLARAVMARQSSRVRNTNTPSRSAPAASRAPAMGGTKGLDPVAMTSRS